MVKDSAYWAYKRIILLESIEYLTEAERRLAEHNVNLIIANQMAHGGESADSIHRFLSIHDPYYQGTMLSHWYRYGGDLPTHNFLRHAIIRSFGTSNQVRQPHFEGVSVHDNCIHHTMQEIVRNFHKAARPSSKDVPDSITIYRGIGATSDHLQYTPHAIESWTTDLDTAKHFANMSHLSDAMPHVYKASVHREDIFASHHASTRLPHIIPPDSALVGKQEIIPFGHKLLNIERVY